MGIEGAKEGANGRRRWVLLTNEYAAMLPEDWFGYPHELGHGRNT